MPIVQTPPPKPLAARLIEARGRAIEKRARVEVIEPGACYQARSTSRPGVVHHLTRHADGWRCSCEGYQYTGMCYHLGQLARRLERERVPVGRIARP